MIQLPVFPLSLMSSSTESAPDTPGVEYLLPDTRLHFTLPPGNLHLTVTDNRCHYTSRGTD